MDPKYRVSVARWSYEPGQVLYLQETKYEELPVVRVLTTDAYEERVTTVNESSLSPADKKRLIGALAMRCHLGSINDQGKLSIPKDICERVKLEAGAEVALIGRGSYFEICSCENFLKIKAAEEAIEEHQDLGIL